MMRNPLSQISVVNLHIAQPGAAGTKRVSGKSSHRAARTIILPCVRVGAHGARKPPRLAFFNPGAKKVANFS